MEKFKRRNLLLIGLAIVLSLFLLIQTSTAYFSDNDSISSGDVNVPHATKKLYATSSGGTKTEIPYSNQNYSFTPNANETYTITVVVTTNYPMLARANVNTFEDVTYNSNWIANANPYSEWVEYFPEEANYDSYHYLSQKINASASAQTFTIAEVETISSQTISIECSLVQANYYALTNMWDDDMPNDLAYRCFETLVVYDGELVIPNNDGTYTISGSAGKLLELRFAYPYAHTFKYNSTTTTSDLTITTNSTTTYNVTLTILDNIVINYIITVQI